jgi:glycosyltransferase involved in cell wall biosynthesis
MSKGGSPAVSAIIPAYNRAHTVGRAIQSVLDQTFQDLEIIVVDDGSTDGTKAIVEAFRDPRIRYLRHERNRGAAAARNTGIRASHGEYLAFLDSDDEWLPHKLEEQIALLKDPTAGWGLTCSGFFLVINGSEREYIHAPCSSWFKRLLRTCDLGPGTTLVVRRECIGKVGLLDEGFIRGEDWDWLLRLSKVFALAVVEKPLARVYKGPLPAAELIQVSTRRFLSKHDEDLRAFGWYYRHQVVSEHWLGLAYWFYQERRFHRGNCYLFKAVLENPLQNPIRLTRVFLSGVRTLLGTSIVPCWKKHKPELVGN